MAGVRLKDRGITVRQAPCTSRFTLRSTMRIALRAYIRRAQGLWSKSDKLELAKRRERLRSRIDAFNDTASSYLRGLHRVEDMVEEVSPLDDEATDEEEEQPFAPADECFTGEPETTVLLLPSSLGYDACVQLKLEAVMEKEIKLREGQANDALDGLRQGIGEKSFMFREHLRVAKGVQQTTRARSRIMAVDRTLTNHRCIYGFAR